MPDRASPHFLVYSRPGCHLCEVLLDELQPLLRGQATIEVRNIDDDPAWQKRYGLHIPVVTLDGSPGNRRRFEPRMTC